MADITELVDQFTDVEDTTEDTDIDDENTTVDEENEADESTEEVEGEGDDENEKAADKTEDDTEGYLADEDSEEDKPADAELPTPPAAAPGNFTAEDKYIVDNLPLIPVRIIGADDQVKSLEVRSFTELPRDMKGFASPYEQGQFTAAIAAQESRARELQSYYRQHQTQIQTQEFERKENMAIREDVADLQRAGEIPRFKAQPGTKAFDDDAAAKIVQETIEFMNDRNSKYLERANKGGSYRHIGFAEAYELMHGKPDTSRNNSNRKEAARKLTSRQGAAAGKTPKLATAGRTIQEVAREFEDFE